MSFSPYFLRSVIRFLVFENTEGSSALKEPSSLREVAGYFWLLNLFQQRKQHQRTKKKKERNGVNVYFALEQLTAAKVNKYIFTTSANRYCYAVDFIYLHDLFFQPQPFFLKLYFNVIE